MQYLARSIEANLEMKWIEIPHRADTDTSQYIAQHLFFRAPCQVHVVASLPCYSPKNVNMQRGSGVFDRSIKGLMKLNALGYGQADSGLKLDLVYNPVGGFLPPEQVREL